MDTEDPDTLMLALAISLYFGKDKIKVKLPDLGTKYFIGSAHSHLGALKC